MQAAAGDTLPENAFPPPPDTVLGSSCTCAGKGRNLVVCIDGTSNKFGRKVRLCLVFIYVTSTLYSFLQSLCLEHERCGAIQSPHERRAATHLLQQRHRYIRATLVQILGVLEASDQPQARLGYRVVSAGQTFSGP